VIGLAQRLAREHRTDEAEAILRRLAAGTTARAATAELARLLQAQRRYAEAAWRGVLAGSPEDQSAWSGLLRVLRLRQRFADAESLAVQAGQRWPAARPFALERARIAAQREDHLESTRRYHAALALPGNPAEPLEELAQSLVAQHRFAATAAIHRQLVEAEPAQPRWREAQAAEEEGAVGRALRHWNEVLHLDLRHLRAAPRGGGMSQRHT
jgi:hypothetical protein